LRIVGSSSFFLLQSFKTVIRINIFLCFSLLLSPKIVTIPSNKIFLIIPSAFSIFPSDSTTVCFWECASTFSATLFDRHSSFSEETSGYSPAFWFEIVPS
jgi:hypothetical protein